MPIDRKKIALVHVARAQTGTTEPEYRAMLESLGVTTSKALTAGQFAELMARFERLGFKPRRRRGAKPPADRAPLRRKIEAQLIDMNLPDAYADGMARRMFGIEKLAWCSPDQLHKIVAALAYHQKKKDRENPNRKGATDATQ